MDISKGITFALADISEVQLAKAAMQAGREILIEYSGITVNDLDSMYIAGSFGNYLNPESARILGLVPSIEISKIKSIGNAAGEGAREMLLSQEIREDAERIAREVEVLELMDKKYDFNSRFIDSMFFT